MADLIERGYLIGKFENTGQPAVSEMGKGYDLGIAAALRVVKNAPAVNRWIPCSERLPEAGMPVLIYACKHRVTAYYDNCKNLFRLTENDNLYYIAEYVTHWMPLPEPPEKE
jgi:hypothetical protein